MPDQIKDGVGKGYLAKVTSENRLATESVTIPQRSRISISSGKTFQALGSVSLSSGTVVPLFLMNDSSDFMVVHFIRHQVVGALGGTSFPNASNYFVCRNNVVYSSGGTEVNPVNMNLGSVVQSGVTVYDDGPTLSGTPVEFDRWYTKADGDMYSWNKEGSLVIPPGHGLELAYITDHSSGLVWTRVSFSMVAAE